MKKYKDLLIEEGFAEGFVNEMSEKQAEEFYEEFSEAEDIYFNQLSDYYNDSNNND